MSVFEAVILAVVEGITEFLPVSSTGHMIIASSVMGIADKDFTKLFTVAIQFGAILSVVVLYFKKFFQSARFYLKLFIAFIPSAILGFLLGDIINSLLENAIVVAIALLIGGVVLLFIDKWFRASENADQAQLTYTKALKIGLFQCISLIPGVSRSAATIIGGLSQKLNRQNAAEFSFFLAVPTMFAATVYTLFKFYNKGGGFSASEIQILLIGNIVAFVVAMLAIKSFISFLTRHGFKMFGYYRIVLGLIIIILYLLDVPLKVV